MITQELMKEKLADLENKYVDFEIEQFAGWENFEKATERLLHGEEVSEEGIPDSYILEFRMMREVMKMEATGKFDWNNTVLKESFEHFAKSPYYKLWGETITKSSLRLSDYMGVKTLVEIGAGRGNLTEIMLQQLDGYNKSINLIVTDIDQVVLESINKLRSKYPQARMKTFLWDIKEPPSEELLTQIEHPCLVYERASIMYASIPAIENIVRIADIVVFGDMFNYTEKLYSYDEISKKIGGRTLFYSEIKPILDKYFREHFMFDLRAQQKLNYPNTTILLAWK
jgi:hypothetical protein